MSHFALICPPLFSHVRAFEAIGAELHRRGHQVTFLLHRGGARYVTDRAFGVETVGGDGAGLDAASVAARSARANGPLGILRTVKDGARLLDAMCRDGPAILSRIGADALLVDQMEPGGALLARQAGLPFLSLACALPIETGPAMPPPFVDWPYDASADGLKRNRGGARVAGMFLREQRRAIAEWALRFGLPGLSTLEDVLSPRGTLAQIVEGFDFPRTPGELQCIGPFRPLGEADAPLPFTPDPQRPLVFASLGTLQGHRLGIFRTISAACRTLGVQLAIAHCGRLSGAEAASLEADFVTDFLPQRAMLARADVSINHAGLNTVLDALEAGVPSLAIPIAFDQPGVAARIEHHGVGLKLSRVLLSERAIRSSLQRLLTDKGFTRRATILGAEVRASGGAIMAADIIERELASEATRLREPAE